MDAYANERCAQSAATGPGPRGDHSRAEPSRLSGNAHAAPPQRPARHVRLLASAAEFGLSGSRRRPPWVITARRAFTFSPTPSPHSGDAGGQEEFGL
ncbi:hypothetical protein MRX96_003788 [Rhipicephalus microplus]